VRDSNVKPGVVFTLPAGYKVVNGRKGGLVSTKRIVGEYLVTARSAPWSMSEVAAKRLTRGKFSEAGIQIVFNIKGSERKSVWSRNETHTESEFTIPAEALTFVKRMKMIWVDVK
jgi:hypothetical protein